MDELTTADGRCLAYRRVGTGPTLVCHPGGPGFSSLYLGELGGLGADFDLVLLDPRGTGGSDPAGDAAAYQIDDYADDLEELRGHLGLDAFDLLGHSHGGVVAMAYAAEHPDRVRRLVAASTLARFGEQQVAAMEAGMATRSHEPWYEDAVDALRIEQEDGYRDDARLAELIAREMPFYFARLDSRAREYIEALRGGRPNGDALGFFNREVFTSFDLRPLLRELAAPTLVVTGEDDFITGRICAGEIAAAIPDARLLLIPASGHFPFVEQPQRFREAVLGFLRT
jgi:proline-specific peptidase